MLEPLSLDVLHVTLKIALGCDRVFGKMFLFEHVPGFLKIKLFECEVRNKEHET